MENNSRNFIVNYGTVNIFSENRNGNGNGNNNNMNNTNKSFHNMLQDYTNRYNSVQQKADEALSSINKIKMEITNSLIGKENLPKRPAGSGLLAIRTLKHNKKIS